MTYKIWHIRYENKVWHMFKVNNKDTRTRQCHWINFTPVSGVSIIQFEHAFLCWEASK